MDDVQQKKTNSKYARKTGIGGCVRMDLKVWVRFGCLPTLRLSRYPWTLVGGRI